MTSKILKPNIGSEWRKWDLHVHTPLSLVQEYGGDTTDVWEKFISDLEKLPEEFKVIGINDYLFLDGYEKVLNYKNSGRLENIDLILPVLEFRLNEFAGVDFGEYTRPNLHVIFADQSILDVTVIKSQFLDTLSAQYKLEKDGIPFRRKLDRQSLNELGQKIIDSVPDDQKSKYGTPDIEGFNNLNLTLEQVQESLKQIDFAKMQKDIDASLKNIDWNKINMSVDKAMKSIVEDIEQIMSSGCVTRSDLDVVVKTFQVMVTELKTLMKKTDQMRIGIQEGISCLIPDKRVERIISYLCTM